MKRPLPDASDIPPLLPEKIAAAKVFASLADYVTATRPRALLGSGGQSESDGLSLEPAKGDEAEGLLVVPRAASPADVAALVARASRRPGLVICFLDYVTWLEGAAKNPLIAAINRAVNDTPAAYIAAFILDPEGLPRIVVGFRFGGINPRTDP